MAHPGSTVDIIELGERQGQLKRKKKLLILQHVQYMLCYRKEQVTAIHLFRELSPPGYNSQRLRFNPVQVDHPPLTPWAHPPNIFFYHGKVLESFCLNPGHMPLESPLLR